MRIVYKFEIVDNQYEFILKVFRLSNELYVGVVFLGSVRVSATDLFEDLTDCIVETHLLLKYVHDGNIQT